MNRTLVYTAWATLIINSLMFSHQGLADINPETIVGAWTFEEGGGKTIRDGSAFGNDGEVKGAPKWVKGVFGSALDFDGAQDHVIIPDSTSLDLNEMTVAAWVNLRAYPDDARIITKELGVVDPWSIYTFLMSGAGESKLEFRPVLNNQRQRVESVADIPLNQWTHIVATYDGEKVTLFINGEIDKEQPATGEMLQNDEPLYLGASQFWDPRFFDGLMDDAVLFNVPLSQEDIQQLMDTGISTTLAVSSAGKMTTIWGAVKTQGLGVR